MRPAKCDSLISAKMLEKAGYQLARIKGSHHTFVRPNHPLRIIPVHHGKVKPVYVRQVQKLLAASEDAS